jgi:uncharacterized membrane protein YadS
MTDIELEGRWSQLMTFISSTKLAESLNDGADARLPSAVQRGPGRNTPEILPGLFLSWVIAGAALAIRQLPGMATFSPVILSMMIGIAFYNIAGTAAWAKQGVTLRVRWLLRIATNTVTDALDEEAACAIACVTVFGSFVMFADPIAADAKAWIVAAATFLSIALAAIGLETDIGRLTAKGFRPALPGALAFLFIAGFGLTLIKLME